MNKVIAIDGPAGSGKGTVAKLISEKLGYVYIDTGATYRCIALKMIQNGVKLEDKDEIEKIASNIDIAFTKDARVYLDGNDVTDEIRSKDVTSIVSQVSSNVKVREYMVELQRKMAGDNDVVMEGRDITTVVFPKADYKFYIYADRKERARRMFIENKEKGIEMDITEVYNNILARDYNDMNKEVGALKWCDDQIHIDTTHKNVNEVVDIMIKSMKMLDEQRDAKKL